MADKPKLAVYWACSCGGCEIAIANLHEHILDVAEHFDFMFCPCLMDTKRKDIEALPDKAITVTLFNGGIRTGENEEMARLMRSKSQVLISFGACAISGGIPALANLSSRSELLATVYCSGPSLENPAGIIPGNTTRMPEGALHLPHFQEQVRSLSQVVPVDYLIPGCPPETEQIWNVLQLVISGAPLPPAGSVIGAGKMSVCDECARLRTEKKIGQFHRTWEIIPDPEKCLLEQGLVCLGVATRSGCNAQCPQVNMPCSGCYGPADGVYDMAGKMASTLGSVLDISPIRDLRDRKEIDDRIDEALAGIPDFAGATCKFTLADRLRASVTASKGEER
jgi:F420-non-reducing hydrogenase small subunit